MLHCARLLWVLHKHVAHCTLLQEELKSAVTKLTLSNEAKVCAGQEAQSLHEQVKQAAVAASALQVCC